MNCPLECPFLREARLREREADVDPRSFPNQDIRVDEAFLRRNEPLLLLLASTIAAAALESRDHVIDLDVREALDGLISTWRARQSGLIYTGGLVNPLAIRIHDAVNARVADIDGRLREHNSQLRDVDVLGVLAFLQRLELQKNNGRRKSRAFIDFLREFFPTEPPSGQQQPPPPTTPPPSGLILP
ncbi:MAG TPA: hypothetical protein VER03_12225 [Bryobacteraceae bacterium]|nr:hypothetical protein [Bryobacteraceae bacterium]